eukprot:2021980-Alexandrium_andersonii.AAC.2
MLFPSVRRRKSDYARSRTRTCDSEFCRSHERVDAVPWWVECEAASGCDQPVCYHCRPLQGGRQGKHSVGWLRDRVADRPEEWVPDGVDDLLLF